jgi:uncharacterized membrane protein
VSAAVLVGDVVVLLFGVFMCVGPLATRPSLQFGVRVPPGYAGAPVIGRERRAYQWRSVLVAIGAMAALIALGGHATRWPSRLILIVEVAADLGCFWWAHQQIAKVKSAEDWFAGRRQTVVADTSWRTEPEAFPARWLLPAVLVIVATVIVGVLRYPHLPAYLTRGDHRVATSPASAFAVVVGQLYVTGLWTGLLVLVYRSRPDLDTADPAASLCSYRKALRAFGRAGLILLACVDASVLLFALKVWQVLHLSGGASPLVALPVVAGLAGFLVTAVRAGRARARTAAGAQATDRDDDRYWKGGIVYVNPGDPALLVGARVVPFGWTVNLGNPTAWLLVAGFLALPAGLVIVKVATGI